MKIKKLEKEEKNYSKLLDKDLEEYKQPEIGGIKRRDGRSANPSGVYLLSNRF